MVGLGDGENLIASDIPALLEHTRKVCFLNENEIVVIRKNSFELYDRYLNRLERDPFIVDWDISLAEKAGYPHFMIKEIEEEPRALADTLLPRLVDGEINLEEAGLTDGKLASVKKIFIVACGTAYHASMLGKYIMEKLLRIPVDVDIASEFRYRNPMIDKDTFMIVLSQSGETADTIAALREGQIPGRVCAGRGQCGGIHGIAGGRRRPVYACRPGDCGCVHQGIYNAADVPLHALHKDWQGTKQDFCRGL